MRRRDDNFPDNGFEAWGGYMQAKIAKLEEQFRLRAKNNEEQVSNIFSGVSIYVNGYTNPSADELKGLMARHGGVYHTYQRSGDYIIASNLPDFKVKKMGLDKVVKTEWITESIASNCLLNYKDYLLYNSFRTQPKLNFDVVTKSECSTYNKTSVSPPNKTDPSVSFPAVKVVTAPSYDESSKSNFNVFETSNQIISDITKHCDTTIKTAADPNFISEFYNNSRLHHISQLGATFKQYINDLRENSDFTFPSRVELKESIHILSRGNGSQSSFEGGKIIMHIDMDCFFVSVGLRKRPELRGQPVAVTHSKGGQPHSKRPGVDRNTEFHMYKQKQAKKLCKAAGLAEDMIDVEEIETRVDGITDDGDKYGSMSEIASCSYEARAKGVSNGMFMGAALRLCPDLQTIPYDFEGYKEVAFTLYNTIAKYTLDIEAVSCDEMYVDCTELLKTIDVSAHDFASALRMEMKEKTGCPCSTGFGGNRLQARLATKHAKPDGQFFLCSDLVNDFMYDIKLRDLPGVGRQTSQKLEAIGHQTCGSLQTLPLDVLQRLLGNKTGSQLYDQCCGRDPTPLAFFTVRKSVSAEVNYGIRFENEEQCFEFLQQLSAEVQTRMVQYKVVGKCITLKLMVRAADAPVETAKFMGHGFCDVINKSVNLNNPTSDACVISKEVIGICKKLKVEPKEMRGIGIQVTKLETTTNKAIKGAMNKYLSTTNKHTKGIKNESNNIMVENSKEVNSCVKKEELVPENHSRTPKKLVSVTSPQRKKSPVIGTSKSPVRRRGRPPKSLSTKPQDSTSINLMDKFLFGQSRDSFNLIEEKYVPANDTSNKLVEINKTNEMNKSPESGRLDLIGLPWQNVKELLRAWLDSGQTPLPCDINLITTYMREMVINKQIDKLIILINFLRRRTCEMKEDKWIEVYQHIVLEVQNAMIAIYGKKLYIEEST
ncbi:hypothetical protein JYU34_013407 [Plutella xylostella]|uniref:DNA repair protein REV1 n=1 Tax=Plutella xylostella TaxID=51655 RepID=A0ABQ7Q9Q0_PLUXY|nr:hypothetical protein JYU34_013407 [Plutella xylostella]